MKVIDLLRELTAVPGVSQTASEKRTGDKIYDMLSRMEHFKENPGLYGRYACPGDGLGREVIYGIVKGSSAKTVVLMGHYDVVGIEDFGKLKDIAYDIDALPGRIAELFPDDKAVLADIESGEWIFGRGAADMKAGVAIDLWLTDELSKNPLPGNVIFLAVPDEESFSVGMRAASGLLRGLKEKHGFDYELCIDSEPGKRIGGEHIVPLGTVGKCMPVVMVQGEKAHISMCFDGLSPLGVLGEIFRATELCEDFCDEFEGEKTIPPSWLYLKDLKTEYDVSLPIRAVGYFSVLSYYSTPDETMDKLRKICLDCYGGYTDKVKGIYENYRRGMTNPGPEQAPGASAAPQVMTMAELSLHCRKLCGYDIFIKELYAEIKSRTDSSELNLPQATMEMMSKMLDFSGITRPLVLLAFAPPYYSPLRSDNVKGKEGKVSEYLSVLSDTSREMFGVSVRREEYMGAMTDLSYCALDRSFDYESFSANTPLWGDIYSIDFDAVEAINIPGMLIGPWGKDYHRASERVYRHDVETRIPVIKKRLVEFVLGGE